jgi:membrane protein
MARDADSQAVRDAPAVATAEGATETPEKPKTGIAAAIAWVMKQRPVRVFLHYTSEGGGLLAAGMTYQAVFALFAAIWVAFSVAGSIVAANPELQGPLFSALNSNVPGLIKTTASPKGIIDSSTLLETSGLTWTGAIALIGLLLTALGFLASMRDSIRRIFDLPSDTTFFLKQKGRDLLLALGFGVLILLSAALSVVSQAALDAAFGLFGIEKSTFAQVVGQTIGYILVLIIDTAALAAAYRLLSAIKIPRRRLFAGALIGGVAIGILKAAFAQGLIGGVGNNALLAGFAVIIGLLIFLNFLCQVMLIGASWISVGMTDARIDPRALGPDEMMVEKARQLEDARRLVADANHKKAEEEYRALPYGWRKRRLGRQILDDARAERRRREAVPTEDELTAAKKDN